MLRRIRWAVPLLLGAVVCLIGCTFPKSFGLGWRQQPEPQAQVADKGGAAMPDDAQVEPRVTSLVQTLRKPVDWLAAKSRSQKVAGEPLLADKGDSTSLDPSQSMSNPNVVPLKYRAMDARPPIPSVANDTSGTPSLVRPSHRPPPDPAPKPPLEEPQESQLAHAPHVDDPLYDMIAAAARSWQVAQPEGTTQVRAPNRAPAPHDVPAPHGAPAPAVAPDQPTPRQLATDAHLKFTPPNLAVRDQKTVRKPLDIATNILRPAKPDPATADPPATAAGANPDAALRTELERPTAPTTAWVAKKSPSPTTQPPGDAVQPDAPDAPDAPDTTQAALAGAAPAGPSNSTAVANTFGTGTGGPAGSPPVVPSQPVASAAGPPPTPTLDRSPATSPSRTEAVTRAESARPEVPSQDRPAYMAKTPSHVRPSVPTQAAPPAAMDPEPLAPLVDAQTYRAQFASASREGATTIRPAARDSSQATSSSWMTTYERLLQRAGADPAPRAPAGSPTRRLSSDDVPTLPQPEAPILRR